MKINEEINKYINKFLKSLALWLAFKFCICIKTINILMKGYCTNCMVHSVATVIFVALPVSSLPWRISSAMTSVRLLALKGFSLPCLNRNESEKKKESQRKKSTYLRGFH